jgi:hypothetical protein
MRKYLIIFLAVSSLIVFTDASCSKDDEIITNDCEITQMTEIERAFHFTAEIMYKDNSPYQGDLSFKIKKEYCNGTVSGEYFENNVNSNSSGIWFSGMSYTYKFANSKDRVIVQLTFTTDKKEYYEWWTEINYETAASQSTTWPPMEYECLVILPWSGK